MSMPVDDPQDLEGSVRGEVLDELRVNGVYVAPKLGIGFLEPWEVA